MLKYLLFVINPTKSRVLETHHTLKVILTIIFSGAAVSLLYAIYSPYGPVPLSYFKPSAYIFLNLLFLLGTTLPLLIITLYHIEEFPVAPGGKIRKAVDFTTAFFLCWAVANILIKGPMFLLGIDFRNILHSIFNILGAIYFLYLICRASLTIFHIKFNKTALIAIPFIFSYALFPLEITLVRDFIHGKENYYFKWLTATEYVLLIFLAILPLMLVFFTYNLKKSTGSLGLEERFKEIADPKTASPEEAYKHALALIDLGKQNKALELLNSVIGSGKFKSDALLQRGKLLFELKNYEEAASDLETYLESKPRTLSEQPFLVLIESYRALEEWENVLEVVNDMHRKFSTNMQSWYSKTEAYIKLKDKDSATKAVDEMMEKWNEVPSYMQPQEKEWMQKGKKLHSAIKLLEK